MWDFLKSLLEQHGLAAVVIVAALAGCGVIIKVLWKRNQELQKEKSAPNAEISKALKGLKGILDEILVIEKALHEAHLGPNAKDGEGRLKWWGASRIEEMFEDLTTRYEEQIGGLRTEFEARLNALQEKRIEEARAQSARIDDLQEKRVTEAQEMVREAMTILQDTKSSVDRITIAMEALRDVVRR